jgi:phosphoglycerate dehydrogenase-like enzyme
LPASHPIFKAPNTMLLPHIGFETAQALWAKAGIALGHLEDFLRVPELGQPSASSGQPSASSFEIKDSATLAPSRGR